jgi:hypothetical protein
MVIMHIDQNNNLYFGDCAQGDRAATPQEIAAWESSRLPVLTYAQKRVAEYPPMADYIDGIVKGDQAQVDAYVAACLAVKAKYPKP